MSGQGQVVSEDPGGVFVGFAIGNAREEFLVAYRGKPDYVQNFRWSLTPALAFLFESQAHAESAIREMQRPDFRVVEIYDQGDQWVVSWPLD